MKLKMAYDNHEEESLMTSLECKDPTLAQQQFKEESDINTIVDRFGLTGEMPQVLNMPQYGDFTGIFDYQTAMNLVVQGREEFMKLPAKMRARFHNDPNELLEFLNDDDNKDEAIKLGLVKAPDPVPESPNGDQAQPAAPKAGDSAPVPPNVTT